MSGFFGEKTSDLARGAYKSIEDYMDPDKVNHITLGAYTTHALLSDPKRFGFMMARHKFVGKMLAGFERVLEIGCQEGFTSLVVAQHVKNLVSVDFVEEHIAEAKKYVLPFVENVEFRGADILDGPITPTFTGAFSLDVFEHIDPAQAHVYMRNVAASLVEDGVFVLGVPSLESQQYASPPSRAGHINCMSGADLHETCKTYFRNVFMFGMNDEVLHTGFLPMCHYLLALCVGPKQA